MHNNSRIGTLVLAAGSSSRLGQPKQLLKITGQTLLRKSAETAYACSKESTIVILGAGHEEHRKELDGLPVQIILNDAWQRGMGTSLKCGISHIIKNIPDLDGVIVMVCDQPMVTSSYLQKMIQTFLSEGNKITASSYAGTLGVPVLFHRALFPSILKIDDEHGAKKIIESNRSEVASLNFPEGAIDIDTAEDLSNFQSHL